MIAPAIGFELRRSAEEIGSLANVCDQVAENRSAGTLRNHLYAGFLQRTTMLECYLSRFDVFGAKHGAAITKVAAGVLNIRSQTEPWRKRVNGARGNFQINDGEQRGLRMLAAMSRSVKMQIDALEPVLKEYGGGRSHEEA